jgi:hypothetical protein
LISKQVAASGSSASIFQDAINVADLLVVNLELDLEHYLEFVDFVSVFVSKSKEKHESQRLQLIDSIFFNQLLNYFEVFISCVAAADNFLLDFGHLVQVSGLDQFSEFLQNIEMLRGVSFSLFELREVFDDALHVLNTIELRLTLLVVQELLD